MIYVIISILLIIILIFNYISFNWQNESPEEEKNEIKLDGEIEFKPKENILYENIEICSLNSSSYSISINLPSGSVTKEYKNWLIWKPNNNNILSNNLIELINFINYYPNEIKCSVYNNETGEKNYYNYSYFPYHLFKNFNIIEIYDSDIFFKADYNNNINIKIKLTKLNGLYHFFILNNSLNLNQNEIRNNYIKELNVTCNVNNPGNGFIDFIFEKNNPIEILPNEFINTTGRTRVRIENFQSFSGKFKVNNMFNISTKGNLKFLFRNLKDTNYKNLDGIITIYHKNGDIEKHSTSKLEVIDCKEMKIHNNENFTEILEIETNIINGIIFKNDDSDRRLLTYEFNEKSKNSFFNWITNNPLQIFTNIILVIIGGILLYKIKPYIIIQENISKSDNSGKNEAINYKKNRDKYKNKKNQPVSRFYRAEHAKGGRVLPAQARNGFRGNESWWRK